MSLTTSEVKSDLMGYLGVEDAEQVSTQIRQRIVNDINGALQDIYTLGPSFFREKSFTVSLKEPRTLSGKTFTQDSTAMSGGDSISDDMLGCTFRIDGETSDNEIVDSSTLQNPFLGETTSSGGGMVYSDCAVFDENVTSIIGPVWLNDRYKLKPLSGRMELLGIIASQRMETGQPRFYWVEPYHSQLRLRVYPMPDSSYLLSYDAQLKAPQLTMDDVWGSSPPPSSYNILEEVLTGLNLLLEGSISATDTVLQAFGRLGNRVNVLWGRTITAGTGLSGGGDLSSDRTLTVSFGSSSGTACEGNDSRLSDARTPTTHATTHQSGGSDEIKLDDLAAPDDNTDLNATTGAHGLLPKLGGGTTNFLRADGTWAAPAGGGDMVSTNNLSDVANAATAWSNIYQNHASDHQSGGGDAVKLDDLAAPDDNTDLNATTGAHGLLPKLGGGTVNFLRADGAWAAPAGGGDLLSTNNLSDVANAATAFSNIKQAATTTATGVVELATDGESAANVVVQGNDSRLSNARTPTAHASTHINGTDDIQDATSGQKGLMTAAYASKLDGIEASADVTDATNVDAAGATMNTDTDVSGNSWVLDEDDMATDSNTKVATQQSVKAYVDGLTASLPRVADGRLSFSSTEPVPTSDIAGATTIYYLPYVGEKIALYDGSSEWSLFDIGSSGLSLSLSGLAANSAFDVFCYDNAGTPTLETLVWTSLTARATALVYQDGVLVKSGATTRRYLGSFRTTGATGQSYDSANACYIWNANNRVFKRMAKEESTASWNYGNSTVRSANNTTSNRFTIFSGLNEDSIFIYRGQKTSHSSSGSQTAIIGIGEDTTSSHTKHSQGFSTANTQPMPTAVAYSTRWLGSKYFQATESSAGASTSNFAGQSAWMFYAIWRY